MASIDANRDPRGAEWEARLRMPVLAAAWLAVPTVFLYFSKLDGALALLAVAMAWAIWAVFVVEATIMLSVVADRRAWLRGHLLGLAIIIATFPLLTHILEGLLAARAISTLQSVRLLQVLYLAKAAKLIKSLAILRRGGVASRQPALTSAAFLVAAAVLVGIGDRVVSGDKHATPLHGTWDLVAELPTWSLALVSAASVTLLLFGVALQPRGGRTAGPRE